MELLYQDSTIIEIYGVSIEVPPKSDIEKVLVENEKIIFGIRNETIFLFDGIQFVFNLDNIESQYGKIFARFHVNTFSEMAKTIMEKFLFDAELLQSKINLKCYHTNIEYDFVKNDGSIKVSLLGEVIP